ncbi:MAG TPA: DUF1670 domain-containing protein, partial [Anaerolineae bacterium]|nr:DUF1670 domain-containing protein [Anaerolineae bacterium]
EPYAPFVAALQQLLQQNPTLLEKLTPLASRLIRTLSADTQSVILPAISSPRALQKAVHQLLRQLTAEQPLVLLFDDVQWADRAFWALLPTLTKVVATQPLALVFAFRSQAMRENNVGWAALTAMERDCVPLRIVLDGFSARESAEFAQQHGYTLNAEQLHQLHRHSHGNPYLLRELLQADDGMVQIDQLLARRLAALTEAERHALAGLSVVGSAISAATWQTLLATPPPIRSLLDKKMIVASSEEYAIEHDLLRVHIKNGLSHRQRKLWHRQVAEALAPQLPPATLAWHFAEAGAVTEAIRHYQLAAEIALSLADFETAHTLAQRANAISNKLDPIAQLNLRILLLQVVEAERYSSENLAEMAALLTLATEQQDQAALLRVLRLQFKSLSARGDVEAVREVAEQALLLSQNLEDVETEIEIHLAVANQIINIQRDVQSAMAWIDHALCLAEQPTIPPHLLVAALLEKLQASARLPERNSAELATYYQRAATLIDQHPYLQPLLPELLSKAAIAAQVTGNYEQAWQKWCQLVEIYQRDGADRPLRSVRYNAALMSMILGQHEDAILYAEELVQTEIRSAQKEDGYYVNQFRGLLVETYTLAGDFDSAEQESQHLLRWLKDEPEGHAARYAWNTIGSLYYYLHNYDAAWHAHSNALALIQPAMQTSPAPYLYIGEVAYCLGRMEDARRFLALSAERLNRQVANSNIIYHDYLDYLVNKNPNALATARNQLYKIACRIQSPRVRHDFLHRSLFHRDIEAAWKATATDVQTVELAILDHVVGKVVEQENRRPIHWTIDAGASDTAYLAQYGKVALRRHRLQRLVTEAVAQGTAPTQSDLASALNVTIRTVQRDTVALAQTGIILQSRNTSAEKKPAFTDML